MATVFKTERSQETSKVTKISYVNCGYLTSYAKYLVEYLNNKRTSEQIERMVEFHLVEKDYGFTEFIKVVSEGISLLGLTSEN
jgi:hypothetical protein